MTNQIVAFTKFLRTFYEDMGGLPETIVLRKRQFLALESECSAKARYVHRPGIWDPECRIDAGNPVIQLETGHGPVRIICNEPLYGRGSESESEGRGGSDG